ncbi:hypothetical protein A3Q56_03330 [Intoshia linei]|uniref:UBC core domain-containing protein n=1 Tax=Intoshia linei TaxID=1819745 RepID=A0A177B5K8_9BILA|nr:hypothetical protein A3Q56_03330 [Intoshia linei]
MNKRILKETERLQTTPIDGFIIKLNPTNNRCFEAIMHGPPDSPYEDASFQLKLFLPEKYPMVAPKIRFISKIYHPNIDNVGRICLDILKDKWTPALQIRTILMSVRVLVAVPNLDDPLVEYIAKHFKDNLKDAEEKAKQMSKLYALPKNANFK